MKKLSIVLTAIVMLFATSSFATSGTEVSATVKAAFSKDFSTAINVAWEKKSDFYFADFKLNDKTVTAAYNESGELVGTARKMDITQLPLSVSLSLAKAFTRFTNSSRPKSCRVFFSSFWMFFSTRACVAMAAESVPGIQSAFLPRMR